MSLGWERWSNEDMPNSSDHLPYLPCLQRTALALHVLVLVDGLRGHMSSKVFDVP